MHEDTTIAEEEDAININNTHILLYLSLEGNNLQEDLVRGIDALSNLISEYFRGIEL